MPIYIIGRQSLFGTGHLTIEYHDPVTKDVFWVGIRRGPETAAAEALQYDGLHIRWDETPSGFGPYELARLAKDTGGIYFLLPSEEGLRIKRREKAYSIETLKEYIPDYESRAAYLERRQKSEFRRTLFDIIEETKSYGFRHHYPVFPDQLIPAIQEQLPIVTIRLNNLIEIEKRLRQLEKLRNREPEKRWQAAYDLMLAQVVTYQIKAYEYRANLLEMAKNPPKPKEMPNPELFVEWSMDHSHERKAPKENTEKPYVEAHTAVQPRRRAPPQHPLGRPRPRRDPPRVQRQAQRMAPQAQHTIRGTCQACAQVLIEKAVPLVPTQSMGTSSSVNNQELTAVMDLTAVHMKVPEGYAAFVEELPGANTQASTLEKAREYLIEAVAMVLEANLERASKFLERQAVTREPFVSSA